MRMWIAGASIALATAAIPLAAHAQCDPRAIVSGCTIATPAANASFVDLMTDGTDAYSRPSPAPAFDASAAQAAATHPAVYVGGGGTGALSQASTAAGVAALASGGDASLAGRAIPGWLGLPSLPSQPAPSFAWVLAIGFLGLIVVRRTRAPRGF